MAGGTAARCSTSLSRRGWPGPARAGMGAGRSTRRAQWYRTPRGAALALREADTKTLSDTWPDGTPPGKLSCEGILDIYIHILDIDNGEGILEIGDHQKNCRKTARIAGNCRNCGS